jgi:hypothetical protein
VLERRVAVHGLSCCSLFAIATAERLISGNTVELAANCTSSICDEDGQGALLTCKVLLDISGLNKRVFVLRFARFECFVHRPEF